MARTTYHPDRGHFIHLNFAPSAGRELASHHYGLVLSTAAFSKATGFAIVCPITSTIRHWPFEVIVPRGHLPPKDGKMVESAVLTDQFKSLDYRERGVSFITECPDAILDDVLAKVRAIIDSDDVLEELSP